MCTPDLSLSRRISGHIGEKLKEKRTARGLSEYNVAAEIPGLEFTEHYRRFESGEAMIPAVYLVFLADFYDCPPGDFLTFAMKNGQPGKQIPEAKEVTTMTDVETKCDVCEECRRCKHFDAPHGCCNALREDGKFTYEQCKGKCFALRCYRLEERCDFLEERYGRLVKLLNLENNKGETGEEGIRQ
jgi:transcriptional regulator with XRE-family HTH domain